jgi:dolichyl-phosphate-mannose--protein O-mannosyl transferase
MSFQEIFYRHFVARVIGLIVIPFIVYLSFFWVHFAILTHSGTGDTFMSPRFQESLAGNELLMNSIGNTYCLVKMSRTYVRLRAQVLRHRYFKTQGYQGSPTFSPRTLSIAL